MFMRLYDQSFMRRLMATVTILFAAQLLLSSACLMAEAAPMAQTGASHKHMDHHADAHPAAPAQQQKSCCNYEKSKQAVSASLSPSLDLPNFVVNTHIYTDTVLFTASSFAIARMPRGPPRSSSLLFSTTQRIRI